MKSFFIKSCGSSSFFALLVLLCAAPSLARADDTTLPEPDFGGDSTPELNLGTSELPIPKSSLDTENKNTAGEAARPSEDQADQVYLPTPSSSDLPSLGPISAPTNIGGGQEFFRAYEEPRSSMERPAFALYLGPGFKSYTNDPDIGTRTGISLGLSYRVFEVAQLFSMSAFAGATILNLGDIGGQYVADPSSKWTGTSHIPHVNEKTYQVGLIGSIDLGRRFSILGGINYTTSSVSFGTQANADDAWPKEIAPNISDAPALQLGVGAQYDFYVIPHGSMGIRGYAQQNLFVLSLAFSMEPQPRKKINLNYE